MLPIRRLSGLLARTGVKKYVRRSEFYEKPSERKRRLGTERHRRRFQEMVSDRVFVARERVQLGRGHPRRETLWYHS
jgi:ribosomal protein S21